MSADTADTTHTRRTPTWLVSAVAGTFGLFYAYAVWAAVGLLIAPSPERTGMGWAVLAFTAVFPILVFVAGVLVGRRRNVGALVLILAAGLGLVGVFLLNVFTYALTAGTV